MLLQLKLWGQKPRWLLAFIFMMSSYVSKAQNINLSVKDAHLSTVFFQIEQQTKYRFVYTEEVLAKAKLVTFTIKNAAIEAVLQECLRGQPLNYEIEKDHVIIKRKKTEEVTLLPKNLRGKIISESNEVVSGVTIVIKESSQMTTSSINGDFYFSSINLPSTLIISGAEIESQETIINNTGPLVIVVKEKINELDRVIMMAYGQTTRRLNTGNISKISSETISKQPIGNVLTAIQSRVPGLQIAPSSGMPGSAMTIRVRGRSSIAQGSDPLILVDGIPFAPNNDVISSLSSSAGSPSVTSSSGGISPLYSLNPSDIESIEILKDADATAIYGSRGANGVILITTKKGKSGKTKIKANVYTGWNTTSNRQQWLTTPQYLEMRKEGFTNDNISPSVLNAPDLLVFDQARDNNFQKQFTGGSSRVKDIQISASGGGSTTQYLIGGGYRIDKNDYQGDLSNERASVHFRLDHQSDDKKYKINFNANFSNSSNKLISRDLTQYISSLPPNMPALLSSSGDLLWNYRGVNFSTNPYSYSKSHYHGINKMLLANMQVSYKVAKGLTFRTALGYNSLWTDENSIMPISAQNPASSVTGSANFNLGNRNSWILEPQLEYSRKHKSGLLTTLIGGSWQRMEDIRSSVSGLGYINDASLHSLSGAASITATNANSLYKYAALFGRLNYAHKEKYLVNLSARRDGSSRFGPGQQFQNFGAVGFAWVFSKERWWNVQSIPFGKLRLSYGITGNDQIGDYKYLDSWTNTRYPYSGTPGLTPTRLSNPNYQWETNRKLELGLDLSFLNDRLLASFAYYVHRSGNQLVDYKLPSQTGFSSIFRNFPAIVRNNGLEVVLSLKTIQRKNFNWTTEANLTISRNRLLSFPGLETSSYATSLEVGKSLSVLRGLVYKGVNPTTGLYEFEDRDRNGLLNSADFVFFGNLDPSFSAGLTNTINLKRFSIEFFADYVSQTGANFLRSQAERSYIPGLAYNQPVEVMSRWRKPGDVSSIQRFTASTSSAAYAAQVRLFSSNGAWTNASFFRIKNISLDYRLPERVINKWKLGECKCFIQIQNLCTFSNYNGGDPELRSMSVLPMQRSVVVGITLSSK